MKKPRKKEPTLVLFLAFSDHNQKIHQKIHREDGPFHYGPKGIRVVSLKGAQKDSRVRRIANGS